MRILKLINAFLILTICSALVLSASFAIAGCIYEAWQWLPLDICVTVSVVGVMSILIGVVATIGRLENLLAEEEYEEDDD